MLESQTKCSSGCPIPVRAFLKLPLNDCFESTCLWIAQEMTGRMTIMRKNQSWDRDAEHQAKVFYKKMIQKGPERRLSS